MNFSSTLCEDIEEFDKHHKFVVFVDVSSSASASASASTNLQSTRKKVFPEKKPSEPPESHKLSDSLPKCQKPLYYRLSSPLDTSSTLDNCGSQSQPRGIFRISQRSSEIFVKRSHVLPWKGHTVSGLRRGSLSAAERRNIMTLVWLKKKQLKTNESFSFFLPDSSFRAISSFRQLGSSFLLREFPKLQVFAITNTLAERLSVESLARRTKTSRVCQGKTALCMIELNERFHTNLQIQCGDIHVFDNSATLLQEVPICFHQHQEEAKTSEAKTSEEFLLVIIVSTELSVSSLS